MVWCVANHEIVKRPFEKKIWSIQKEKKTHCFPTLRTLIARCCGNRLTIAAQGVGR